MTEFPYEVVSALSLKVCKLRLSSHLATVNWSLSERGGILREPSDSVLRRIKHQKVFEVPSSFEVYDLVLILTSSETVFLLEPCRKVL
jgi:hypothetical protein